MQVEVCVQECIDQADFKDGSTSSELSSDSWVSISSETWESWFQQWLEILQPDFSPIQQYELSLRLTSDREIQTLNYQYRQQDKPTDVLAFAALETEGAPSGVITSTMPLYLGDIVISVATAQQQAQAQRHPLEIELAWLATHGLLHLLRWDHPDEASLTRMLNQQQVLLNAVGLMVRSK